MPFDCSPASAPPSAWGAVAFGGSVALASDPPVAAETPAVGTAGEAEGAPQHLGNADGLPGHAAVRAVAQPSPKGLLGTQSGRLLLPSHLGNGVNNSLSCLSDDASGWQ